MDKALAIIEKGLKIMSLITLISVFIANLYEYIYF
jgi:hypothetical protein